QILESLQIHEGENIWELSPGQLAERVESIARIESASVYRKLPRTLVVDVTEKGTLCLVPYREYLFAVGFDGTILGVTNDPQNYGLPLVTGIAPLELKVGDLLFSGERLERTTELITAMDGAGIAVSEINFSDEENLVLVTMSGLTVWLGRDGFQEKAGLLAQIMGQLTGRQDEGYLDLRVPTAPAFHILNDSND
ncbi:MAG: FtsQ-type POTRA domain-containing protein, partial [Bacillota bacterium]|nr:FtsQ-type POTRA domain-containing protein [Bacillota bacterium]